VIHHKIYAVPWPLRGIHSSAAVGWIRFLQIIGGTEKQARALLKDLSRKGIRENCF
jgi:hypothetical protein